MATTSSAEVKATLKKSRLDTRDIGTSLWLVKIPTFVAEKWSKKSKEDIIGSISITTKAVAGGKLMKKINVSLADEDVVSSDNPEDLPPCFTLEDLPLSADQQLLSFSESVKDESYSVCGQVTKKFLLKPDDTQSYRKVVRCRAELASAKPKTLAADPIAVMSGSRSNYHVVDFIPPVAAEMKRRKQELQHQAKSRGMTVPALPAADLDSLKSKFFDALSGNNRRGIKELLVLCTDIAGMPREKEVKELIDSYARYHSKGPYRGMYELKPEFQDARALASNISDLEASGNE